MEAEERIFLALAAEGIERVGQNHASNEGSLQLEYIEGELTDNTTTVLNIVGTQGM